MLNRMASPVPAPAAVRSGSIWANFPKVPLAARLVHPAYDKQTGSQLRQFTSSMMLYPEQFTAAERLLNWGETVHVHTLGTSCGDLMEYWAQRLGITHGKKAALTGVEQHRAMWMIAQQRQYVITQYELDQAKAYGQGHPLSEPYFSKHFERMNAAPPWFGAYKGSIPGLHEMVECPLTKASVANGQMGWYQPTEAVKAKLPKPNYLNTTVQDYLAGLAITPPKEAQHVVVGNNTLGHLNDWDFMRAFANMAKAFKGKRLWVLTDAREREKLASDALAQRLKAYGFTPLEEHALAAKKIPDIPGWVEARERGVPSHRRPQNIWVLNTAA